MKPQQSASIASWRDEIKLSICRIQPIRSLQHVKCRAIFQCFCRADKQSVIRRVRSLQHVKCRAVFHCFCRADKQSVICRVHHRQNAIKQKGPVVRLGPLALLGAFISLAELGIAQPEDCKIVCSPKSRHRCTTSHGNAPLGQ